MSNPILQTLSPSVLMTSEPAPAAEASNELLHGEKIEILEEQGDFIRARALHDGYEGWVMPGAFTNQLFEPKYKITALNAHLYSAPDFKSPPLAAMPFMAQVIVTGEQKDGWIQLSLGGWIWGEHIDPIGNEEPDYVETALRFLEAPYLWGGRTPAGIDCSGLVQIALMASGIPCDRDTKDQINTLGNMVDGTPERGDIVFFKGHVGIMLDESYMVNATSRHMGVRIETLDSLEHIYSGITAIKRLPDY